MRVKAGTQARSRMSVREIVVGYFDAHAAPSFERFPPIGHLRELYEATDTGRVDPVGPDRSTDPREGGGPERVDE